MPRSPARTPHFEAAFNAFESCPQRVKVAQINATTRGVRTPMPSKKAGGGYRHRGHPVCVMSEVGKHRSPRSLSSTGGFCGKGKKHVCHPLEKHNDGNHSQDVKRDQRRGSHSVVYVTTARTAKATQDLRVTPVEDLRGHPVSVPFEMGRLLLKCLPFTNCLRCVALTFVSITPPSFPPLSFSDQNSRILNLGTICARARAYVRACACGTASITRFNLSERNFALFSSLPKK